MRIRPNCAIEPSARLRGVVGQTPLPVRAAKLYTFVRMQLRFDNSFARGLPADPDHENRRRQVHGACFSRTLPTRVSAPYLVAHSREMAEQLGLTEHDVQSPEFLEVFAGNRVLDEMSPVAACYGGHQFGNWAGQLGDGRAISLGEVIGRDDSRWELQLKGAGPTPYSRMGDGRAVMRSSVREFLCSEAMHHLGVPTTRALSLVGTGEMVKRDMLYDGNERLEPGAIVCRVAPTFIRFGNFELFSSRDDRDTLRRLADYTIAQHFPHLVPPSGAIGRDQYFQWYQEVCTRTAALVAQWMRVGFVHGVLNTDNMSILGLTIDYGPYGWLEDYDPDWTPNTTDAAGRRYRFGFQPRIAGWNLARFGEAILPLTGSERLLEEALMEFIETLDRRQRELRLAKLGLSEDPAHSTDADDELCDSLDELLSAHETDMTLFYRNLSQVNVSCAARGLTCAKTLIEPLLPAFYSPPGDQHLHQLVSWLRRWALRVRAESVDEAQRVQSMNATNPKFVLRNYLAQLAIDDAERGDFELVRELLDVLRHPYDEQPGKERFAEKRPEWARHRPGCSMLSCSS